MAVVLGVMTAGLGVVMLGMAGVTVRTMGMVSCLFVMTGLMVFGGLAMMLCSLLVMFSSLVMVVFHACVFAHASLPIR